MLKIFKCLKGVRLRYVNFFLLLSVLYLGLIVPGVVSAQVVDIPDPNLRAAIASALGQEAGAPITAAGLLTLERLEAKAFDISDLTGLEHATNLTALYLGDNNISDITSVSGLTNLRHLGLLGNNISDITSVSGLTNLRDLDLSINNISDITSVSGLTNLTVLDLSFNNITEITSVSGLTNLRHLYLSINNISDLLPLVSNTGLGQGDFVNVSSNPLNAASIDTHIPTLQARGVEVNFDAQPTPAPVTADVNGDGQVTVIDLAIVALFYGTQVPAGLSLPADVNADGIVNILDLTAVAQGLDAAGGNAGELSLEAVEAALAAAAEQAAALEDVAAAPMGFSTRPDVLSRGKAYVNVTHAFTDAGHLTVSDMLSAFLTLLTEMGAIPETTALLPNYPNPFNPETWIPYHLSKDAEVTLTIYDVRGSVVRTLRLGHQPAGVYESKHRAAYWDGRNQHGEPVASGLYFYTLTAGEFTATRKLLIVK